MNKKILIIGGAIVVFFGIIIAFSFNEKCPAPEDNIPNTPTFRDDCDIVTPGSTDTNNVLDLWVLYDNTEAFQEQIQAFQSNNLNIRVDVKKFTNLEEYEDLIVNEIADGEGPDVFMIHNSWIEKHLGKLYPLPMDQSIVMTPELFRETYFQAASDDLIVEEQIYGMPMSIDNLAIFYNKQHFEDLIADTDKPGILWDEIKEQVSSGVLTKKDNSLEGFANAGIAMGRADNISSAVDILYALMLEYGVEFYDEQEEKATFANTQSGGGTVDNPGVEALKLFTEFGLPSYRHYSWNENITGLIPADKELSPFIRNKVSMIIGYPYMYENIKASINAQQQLGNEHINLDDVGIAPFPQLVNPEQATQRDTYASYFPLVVARTSDKPAMAWSLVQYLTSREALQSYHKITNRPTSRRDMADEQRIEPLFGTFAEQASFAKSFRIYDDTAYRKIFSDAIQEVIKNTSTAEEALIEAQGKVTCVIQKQKGIIDIGTDCQI